MTINKIIGKMQNPVVIVKRMFYNGKKLEIVKNFGESKGAYYAAEKACLGCFGLCILPVGPFCNILFFLPEADA